jgi:hypothetical protein
MNRIVKILIVAAIVALLLNDGGRWSHAILDLHSSTSQVLDQVSLTARRSTSAQLADQLAKAATNQQIRVTQYAVTSTGVHIWTEEDVAGTWVVGPYMAMTRGVPFAKAWNSPFVITYDAEQALQ